MSSIDSTQKISLYGLEFDAAIIYFNRPRRSCPLVNQIDTTCLTWKNKCIVWNSLQALCSMNRNMILSRENSAK